MNNSINFSGFVDMCRNSSDDYEPYGYAAPPAKAEQANGKLDLALSETGSEEPLGE